MGVFASMVVEGGKWLWGAIAVGGLQQGMCMARKGLEVRVSMCPTVVSFAAMSLATY